MQHKIATAYFRPALLLCVLGGAVATYAQTPSGTARVIELTEADLFASSNWLSTEVSIVGFHLGMTLSDVRANAKSHGFRLERGGAAFPCEGADWCDVTGPGGTYVILTFDPNHGVTKISLDAPPDYLAPKELLVARFKGATYELFNHYSDSLRIRLLGNKAKRNYPACYSYASRGFTICSAAGRAAASADFTVPTISR